MTITDSLAAIVGAEHVQAPVERRLLEDASASRGIRGRAAAAVRPGTAEEVAQVVRWCYEHDVAIVPRGGGTGFSGGAVPGLGDEQTSVVLALERLDRVRAFDPESWRICVEAGVRTARIARLARESGLYFAPDPGAAEDSQIGGNIATNAGGPHTFKYGVMREWVSGLEVVLAPGELVSLGGPVRKDAAGYDLLGLLVGSEGTLGVVTAAWLRLLPAPPAAAALAAFYRDPAAGARAVERLFTSGVVPAVIEFLDGGALAAAGGAFPGAIPPQSGLCVLCEADGGELEVEAARAELREALAPEELGVEEFTDAAARRALWRWRDGVSLAVTAQRGGKLSEDIVVPLERLADAIEQTVAIGARHGLEACSWGHAGDGNLHSTFLLDPERPEQARAAERAAGELFEMALALGGSISGEHGIGWVKRGRLRRQWGERGAEAHRAIKAALDPKGLLNPGKKLA